MSEGQSRFDAATPNIARMYDYYLGGKDYYAADRRAAQRVLAAAPEARTAARANRAFLGRAVHHLAAEASVRQPTCGTRRPSWSTPRRGR